MQKKTIEVVILEPTKTLDQDQINKLAAVTDAEVEGHGHWVYVRCPHCGAIVMVDTDAESFTCPNCGPDGTVHLP